MMQQTQEKPGASLPFTSASIAATSSQEANEPPVRLHSGSSASTQPTSFQNLSHKGPAANKNYQQQQVRLPTVLLPRRQQVDEYFVGEDREDVCDVFVGNILPGTSEEALRDAFEQVVAVHQVTISTSGTGLYDCGFVK